MIIIIFRNNLTFDHYLYHPSSKCIQKFRDLDSFLQIIIKFIYAIKFHVLQKSFLFQNIEQMIPRDKKKCYVYINFVFV